MRVAVEAEILQRAQPAASSPSAVWRPSVLRSLVLSAVVLTLAAPAASQERLIVYTPQGFVAELATREGELGATRRVATGPATTIYRPLPGGRHAAVFVYQPGGTAWRVGLLDTATLTFAMVPGVEVSELVSVAVDPLRPRLFVRSGAGVEVVEPPGVVRRVLTAPGKVDLPAGGFATTWSLAFSPSTGLAYVERFTPGFTRELVAVDPVTGEERASLALDGVVTALEASASGDLWALVVADDDSRRELRRYSAATLSIAARLVVPPTSPFDLRLTSDEGTGGLLVSTRSALRAWALSADLEPTGFVDFATLGLNPPSGCTALMPSPAAGRALGVVSREDYTGSGGFSPGRSFLVTLDPVTLAIRESVDLRSAGPFRNAACLSGFLMTAPLAPRSFGAGVTARQVALTWDNRGNATQLVVEAGLAPGRTDVRLPVAGDAASLTVSDVPPGTYFVRVRAYNELGSSPPSPEVRVEVR